VRTFVLDRFDVLRVVQEKAENVFPASKFGGIHGAEGNKFELAESWLV